MAQSTKLWLKSQFQLMRHSVKTINWKSLVILSLLGMVFLGFSLLLGFSITTFLFLGLFIAAKISLPQKAVNLVKATSNTLNRSSMFLMKYLLEKIKIITVNTLSTQNFVRLARVLPIGDWLLYEETPCKILKSAALFEMIQQKDYATIDDIIKVTSEETFYQLLLAKDFFGLTPIEYATILKENPLVVEKLLRAVKPHKRLILLKSLKFEEKPYIFSMLSNDNAEKITEVVMELLPQNDHLEFMNQRNNKGDTPINYLSYLFKPKVVFETFLKYYPKEHLLNYLKTINDKGRTVLTRLICDPDSEALEYVMSLIPESERTDFLGFHHQGEKALIIAHVHKKLTNNKKYLTSYGVILPERFNNVTKRDIAAICEEWESNEQYKKVHGFYPFEILQVEDTKPDEDKVKKQYKRLLLQNHPDRNPSENAHQITQELTAAYEFYTKPETRQNLKNRS